MLRFHGLAGCGFVVVGFGFGACVEGGSDVERQPIEIPFAAVVGTEAFACNGSFAVGTPAAQVDALDLRFYLSDIAIRSGDERVAVELDANAFQGEGIVLLDFEDDSGSCATGSPETHTSVTGTIPGDAQVDGIVFTLGVPEELNHLDAATGPAPLNVPAMWWSWSDGYKFLKLDIATPTQPEFYFHLGATSCAGDPTAGFDCAFGNVAEVEVDGAEVEFDVAEVYRGLDVTASLAAGDSIPGCMSFAGDPQCPSMFAPLGLGFEGQAPTTQTLFRGR